LFAGLAPDGGLYLPERLDPLPRAALEASSDSTLSDVALEVAAHLIEDEIPRGTLAGIVRSALDFPIPLMRVAVAGGERPRSEVYALELFHGPTLAFKDVGARVMARLMAHFTDTHAPLTVLVATSGDTGSAVARAFAGVAGTRVVVLFPEGQVSDVQEAQFATVGGNVEAVAVAGTFDDCQALVKTAFADGALRRDVRLSSANSINVGRLLPQVFYYVWAGVQLRRLGSRTDVVMSVPSGNFGNLTAGLVAKRLGLQVARFVAATNVNDVVPQYLRSGRYTPRGSVRTVANAMDVGAPSNFERIRVLYGDSLERLRTDLVGAAFDDAAVTRAIADVYGDHGYLLDPHSAIAWLGLQEALAFHRDATGVLLATAHPAKFRETVEPAIGARVDLPPPLAAALQQPRLVTRLNADYAMLRELLTAGV
jgi:threonine synthase